MKKYIFLFLISFSALAVDIPITQQNVNLSWTHPTEYVGGGNLPVENILSTTIERSCGGLGFVSLADVVAPISSYSDPVAAIGINTCEYRAFSVVIGNVISDASNVVVVNIVPKQSNPQILMVE